MKLFYLLTALNAAMAIHAHFTMQYIWVNGVDQGLHTAMRFPPNHDPVLDLTSTNLTCNVGGISGLNASTVSIPAGSNITFEWHQNAERTGEDAITSGHKGPVQVYIAKAPSTAASFDGQGNVWTKIYQSGLLTPSSDPELQVWATSIVNATGGKHSVIIPASLPAGEYLLRPEIISLHNASTYPGAQFYMGCAQVKIESGGSASPPTMSIPGIYKPTDPGITIDIWTTTLQNYTLPGGAVWSG